MNLDIILLVSLDVQKFFFKSQFLGGRLSLPTRVSDYAWVTKQELLTYVDDAHQELFKRVLLDWVGMSGEMQEWRLQYIKAFLRSTKTLCLILALEPKEKDYDFVCAVDNDVNNMLKFL